MTDHCKIYLAATGLGIEDFVPCENCGQRGTDIHHIRGRGKGKDVISNLMCLCRKCHRAAHGDAKTYLHKDVLQTIHDNYLRTMSIKYIVDYYKVPEEKIFDLPHTTFENPL